MKIYSLFLKTTVVALGLSGGIAHAATLFSLTGPTPELASPGFLDETFAAGAGPGALSFTLDGYGSLDGANVGGGLDDQFTLSLNGVAILIGEFNISGGGQNIVSLQPLGSAITVHTRNFGLGGTVDISAPLDLLAGSNTLRFAYASATPQGVGDEGFGIQDVTVTGSAPAGGVPEPDSWALMLAGAFALGTTLRRRIRSARAAA